MALRVKRFIVPINEGVRTRTHIERDEGKVTHFAVSLEYESAPDNWQCIARYDTEGGSVHLDTFLVDGTRVKHREPVHMSDDYQDAISNARVDFANRYKWFIEQALANL